LVLNRQDRHVRQLAAYFQAFYFGGLQVVLATVVARRSFFLERLGQFEFAGGYRMLLTGQSKSQETSRNQSGGYEGPLGITRITWVSFCHSRHFIRYLSNDKLERKAPARSQAMCERQPSELFQYPVYFGNAFVGRVDQLKYQTASCRHRRILFYFLTFLVFGVIPS
jgi:hypothetical protein